MHPQQSQETAEQRVSDKPSRSSPLLFRHSLWAPALVSLLLSCVAIAVPSPRWDEAATMSATTRSLPELWSLLGNIDAVHGLYYLLLHPLLALFGPSLVVGRIVSALMIAVATAAVSVLGARLMTPRLGLAAGLVFALLPVTSHYGMEMRSQAVTTAVISWATYALVVLLRGQNAHPRRWWAGYTLGMIVATYLNVFSLMILLAHWVTLLLCRRNRATLVPALVASVIIGAITLPLVLVTAGQSGQVGWIGEPDRSTLIKAVQAWSLSPGAGGSVEYPPGSRLLLILLWLAVLIGTLVALRRVRQRPDSEESTKLLFAVALPWLLLPTLILLMVSLVEPFYHRSYVFFCTPAFALLVAYSLLLIRRRLLLAVAAVMLVLLTIPTWMADRSPGAKGNLEPLAGTVAQQYQPGDAIVFLKQGGRRIAALYPDTFHPLLDIGADQTPVQAGDFVGTQVSRAELTTRINDVDRVWILMRVRRIVPDWMRRTLAEQDFTTVETWSFGRSELLLYERDPR